VFYNVCQKYLITKWVFYNVWQEDMF